jgi:hypothetical protein
MLQNYFKMAWRNLFMNKLHTFLNSGGLVIGFTVAVSIKAIRTARQNPVKSLRTHINYNYDKKLFQNSLAQHYAP